MTDSKVDVDPRVASAIANWGPRFTANGVIPADFQSITATVGSWAEWCGAWSRGAAVHEELGHAALADERRRSAGEHFWRASVYYHFAKFVFVQDLDQMHEAHANAVRCGRLAMPLLDPPGERVSIPFEGTELVGVLRKPAGAVKPAAVVLVPGLDSTKEEFRNTEETFLARGLATFSVDGPGQGEAERDLPIRPDWEVPGRAIVDALIATGEVDADRIGVWGVSLGGYYAPRMASGDDRVKACISLCGPYDMGVSWSGLPALTRETFTVRSRRADDAAAAAYCQEFTLVERAASISARTLVVVGKKDRLFDWHVSQRLAEKAPNAELLLLEDGNHGCANIQDHHRHYAADWMARQLA